MRPAGAYNLCYRNRASNLHSYCIIHIHILAGCIHSATIWRFNWYAGIIMPPLSGVYGRCPQFLRVRMIRHPTGPTQLLGAGPPARGTPAASAWVFGILYLVTCVSMST